MSTGIDPNPKKNMLRSGPFSPMPFMPEQLIYDKESGGPVRFRSMFEMPNWDGVEEDELTYVVDNDSARLDNIAEEAWGQERQPLYWVIAARNNLDLPDVQLYKGRVLKIPSKNWIETKLLPQSKRYLER